MHQTRENKKKKKKDVVFTGDAAEDAKMRPGKMFEIPSDSGVLLSMSSGTCWIEVVKDAHAKHIHPHIHVPASSQDSLQELSGGGSGVTVMRASDPCFGIVVLKHGGYKDTQELFALATIEEQLTTRGEASGWTEAANDLVHRTPDFKYIYISHDHVCDARAQQKRLCSLELPKNVFSSAHIAQTCCNSATLLRAATVGPMVIKGMRLCDLSYQQHHGRQRLRKTDFVEGFLEIHLDTDAEFDSPNGVQCSVKGEGLAYLRTFVNDFIPLQESEGWKITLAQKAIGDNLSQTGSALLAKSMLSGRRLTTLIDEMLKVIRYLDGLTLPEERGMADHVRRELESRPSQLDDGQVKVTDQSDLYVGRAIIKNFDPEVGRFKLLREIGSKFREESFDLTEAEQLPGQMLGAVLERHARLENVFKEITGPTALDAYSDKWLEVLVCAASLEGDKALTSVWTGGLTDGGIHNLFLDENYMWLFDMGDPVVMSLPALLTKFLFSFFHTLGMEDLTGDGNWTNRFIPGELLNLTSETQNLLSKAQEAFTIALDRFVAELFNGEQAVRELLLAYVILQLVSDCAFCLSRWVVKGGGDGRPGLEKWLWRALWDMYIASDISRRMP